MSQIAPKNYPRLGSVINPNPGIDILNSSRAAADLKTANSAAVQFAVGWWVVGGGWWVQTFHLAANLLTLGPLFIFNYTHSFPILSNYTCIATNVHTRMYMYTLKKRYLHRNKKI